LRWRISRVSGSSVTTHRRSRVIRDNNAIIKAESIQRQSFGKSFVRCLLPEMKACRGKKLEKGFIITTTAGKPGFCQCRYIGGN